MDIFPARKRPQSSQSEEDFQLQLTELQEHLIECQRNATQAKLDLQAKNQELEEQLVIRKKLNDRQRSDIESLQEQLERTQLEMAQGRRQQEEQFVELKAEVQGAKDIAQKRVEAVQRFKAELSLSRTTVAELERELNALKQQYSGEKSAWGEQRELLQAQLAGYQETEAEANQRWQEEREERALELQERDRQLLERKQQLEAQALQLEDRDLQLQEQDCQLQELRDRNQKLQEQLTEFEGQQAELTEDLVATRQERDQLQTSREQLEQKVAELEAEAVSLRAIELDHKQLAAAEAQKQDLEKELSSLQKQLKQLELEVGKWKEKFAKQQMHNLALKKALDRPTDNELASVNPAELTIKTLTNKAVANASQAGRSGADLPRFVK